MKLKLIIQIANSLLFARWKQTLIAAIGVMFSITMFIALLSFMTGLNNLLDGLVLNRTPHIRIFNEIKPAEIQAIDLVSEFSEFYNIIYSIKPGQGRLEILNSGAIIDALKNDKRVTGVAPKLSTQVFYNVGAIDITGLISGIDVKAESELFFFKDYVVKGNADDLMNVPNSIILGIGAANKMLVNIGDIIQVTSAKGERMQLKVVGFFQSGMQEIDKVQSFTTIKTAQKILSKPSNYITDIQVKLTDIAIAPATAVEYRKLFETDAEDIQTANATYETGSSIRTLISYAVGITLLIVAGFGIYNILNMMIFEKMDSIAILKATGFSGSDVRLIFITLALSIGIFGSIMGLVFGFGLSVVIDNLPFETEALPTVKTFPVNYDMIYYIIGISFGILTTYFAGSLPANKAGKIDPVDIIRGK